ncbi:sulfate ABC transporter permease subunit CysT [Spirochaeta africana]|uniref:Sulfate transport system permease protein CysT n=1 Tax=Spirochaeta africana (strain ATCC 700263 / DSM 8902 / Z-7692) TaxID=889378 RepID=H9ULT1_SPIAZ|nr:sulfate ABC transporter permease subunit CysT [Spirochaeta africana]AFG38474.1 sulfate ABC transporter, permease protein CysT [Spirochaeta africana DSM 8902]
MKRQKKTAPVLPGRGLSLGITISYMSFMVLLPLAGLAIAASGAGWHTIWWGITSPMAVATYRLTLAAALGAALVNAVFGTVTAWVLARYRFPGRGVIDTIIDLPFALPGAVGGLALVALVSENGLIGRFLEPLGIRIAYTAWGVPLALLFVGIPYVVRSVEPVIENLDPAMEEAAASLGASPGAAFMRVILPGLLPAILSGFTMALARGLGEYGSVIFVAGNVPFESEVTSRLIYNRLDQYDTVGATAVALLMVLVAFVILLLLNVLQVWQQRRIGATT